jgi:spore photoproduct lyase
VQSGIFFRSKNNAYQSRQVTYFEPARIVLTRGWNKTAFSQSLTENILSLYQNIQSEDHSNTAHPKILIDGTTPYSQHTAGKQTLVIGEHRSAVRLSTEDGNTCPNYWHFSLYGFCPYGCTYCYLAGTPGVKFSPSVKIFTNVDDVLSAIDKESQNIGKPTAFYHGKLQDGLALDPLTGYSRQLIPFFAEHPFARQVLLTKSIDVENLIDLDHNGHTILSWTLQPPTISAQFEPNTPSIADRLCAMKRCIEAGYPVRAVLMPLIPIEDWLDVYMGFLTQLLEEIPIKRLTIGAICSYQAANQLMNRKLGHENAIAQNMQQVKTEDGRMRYSEELREKGYRHLIQSAKSVRPDLEIGLCLETHKMFTMLDSIGLNMQDAVGRCNCVL